MKNKIVKKRNWAFVLYPESAPIDWFDVLQEKGIPFCVSPLHDKDVDPNGECKKSHYHIILSYSGPTSFNVVKSITEQLGQPVPIALEQVRGYYRYLTHQDNPDKYQYDSHDIKCMNGFDANDFMDLTSSEIDLMMMSLQQLIRDNDIKEYSDFMDFLLDSDMRNEYHVASTRTLFFDRYISSIRHKFSETLKK